MKHSTLAIILAVIIVIFQLFAMYNLGYRKGRDSVKIYMTDRADRMWHPCTVDEFELKYDEMFSVSYEDNRPMNYCK
jgi:hypothetical protein